MLRNLIQPARSSRRRRVTFTSLQLEELEPRRVLSAGVGINQALTTDPGVQQMPSVAVNPLDAEHVVVAYMDYSLVDTGYAGIGVAVSRDAGETWQHSAVPLPPGFDEGAANPIARFDDQGHVFVSYMAATFLGHQPGLTNPAIFNPDLGVRERTLGLQANNGVFVARSGDGGLAWDQPATVVSHRYDGQNKVPFEIMPELAIDTFPTLPDGRPNPFHGSLYMVWSRYYPAGQFPGEPEAIGGSDIMFAVSRDGGLTWQTQLEPQAGTGIPVTVIQNYNNSGLDAPEGLGHENWSHVTVGPEGDIYVSNFLGGDFGVHHSADGGSSFVNPDPATNTGFPFDQGSVPLPSPNLATSQFRTQVVRAVAADPTRPGQVYVAEAIQIDDPQGNFLDEGDVIFARSSEYGATWQSAFQIGTEAADVLNDDNGGLSAAHRPDDVTGGQALPRLVTDTQGNVAVIWYDTRRDPANHFLDVFGTVSTDGGQTFSPNFRVTDQSFEPDAG